MMNRDVVDGFWENWNRHPPHLFRKCLNLMGDADEAEDALSTAMLRAFDKTIEYTNPDILNFNRPDIGHIPVRYPCPGAQSGTALPKGLVRGEKGKITRRLVRQLNQLTPKMASIFETNKDARSKNSQNGKPGRLKIEVFKTEVKQ